MNKYASVMPYHFQRPAAYGLYDPPYGSTSVPNDTSFALVNSSDFLVFDRQRGLALLGPNPSYTYMFDDNAAVHEAPVYVASQNKLYLSEIAPIEYGLLPQLVIDLNANPPTLNQFYANPPIYAVNGGTFHNGLIYVGAAGGLNSIGGMEQRPSLRTFDPNTNKSVTLLNNYFGYYFNNVDDLFVHPTTGDIWFTDPQYSWFDDVTDTAPQLEAATYRFRPSTGAVNIVEDSILQPNGIAISPDASTVYIADSGAYSGSIVQAYGPGLAGFNQTGKRTVYAFDMSADGTYITNKRAIWYAQDWLPDGLKVARNGYVVTATGMGLDILDPEGTLLVRVQTNYTVQNFAWTGPNLSTLWMCGEGGISKVEWALQGQVLK